MKRNPNGKSHPIFILLFFLWTTATWAADVYIDPDWNGTESGTFAEPYNSWTDFTITAGNDYRQKCGTTYNGTIGAITATGTSANYIVIGAYNADGIHEDGGNETFGQYCSEGLAKPILKTGADNSGVMFSTSGGGNSYLEFNSISVQTVQLGFRLDSSYIKISYTYLFDYGDWAIKVGASASADYVTVEYNFVDLNDSGGNTVDAMKFQSNAHNGLIQYNHIPTNFNHSGIYLELADNMVVQYNYIYKDGGISAVNCIDLSGANTNNNIIRYNFCEDAGSPIKVYGGNNCEVYGNVLTGDSDEPHENSACIKLQAYGSANLQNNKVYNNVCYDTDTQLNINGLLIVSLTGTSGTVSDNSFTNNIVHTTSGNCIRVADNSGIIGTNYFNNNSCYEYDSNYARIEGATKTVSQLNSESYASGNIDGDPGLENPASHQLWPDSESDNVVGAGYDLGSSYDDLLDPDNTDFTASPPTVTLAKQPANWNIGAYAMAGTENPDTTPPEKPTGLEIIE